MENCCCTTKINCSESLKKDDRRRFYGAVCIVAGTAIGAAMLALPVSMGRAGFIPSVITFFFSWAFMLYPALLLLELCLCFRNETNIISLASKTLGSRLGAWTSSLAYVCLLYSLMTAYIAALSFLVQSVIKALFSSYLAADIPSGVVAAVIVLFLSLIFMRGISMIDMINRIFTLGLCLSFFFVIASSFSYCESSRLMVMRWEYLLPSLSIGFTSFGFHVVIPSLSSYLGYKPMPLKRAIVIGSLLPLIAYVIWQAVCLSAAPMTGGFFSIDGAFERGISGANLLGEVYGNPLLSMFSDGFAVTAIVTSFLGVSLSIVDFVKDGVSKFIPTQSLYPILLAAFIPPVWFSTTSPQVFFHALEVAGIFGVVLLLSFLPTCMVWSHRYGQAKSRQASLSYPHEYRAPGGKKTLLVYGALSLSIIISEIVRICS